MPEPVFVALLLADRVITEDNQKKAIIGTFTQFTVRQVPARLAPWFIYAAVTNLAGEHSFSLNLVVDRSQQVIFSAGGTLTVDESAARRGAGDTCSQRGFSRCRHLCRHLPCGRGADRIPYPRRRPVGARAPPQAAA